MQKELKKNTAVKQQDGAINPKHHHLCPVKVEIYVDVLQLTNKE